MSGIENQPYSEGPNYAQHLEIKTHSDNLPEGNRDIPRVRAILLKELLQAVAPITGKRVACILETSAGFVSGHNVEHGDPPQFDHAESMAIQRMREVVPSGPIERIYLGGSGYEKIKQVSPCSECYDHLSPFFSPTIEIVLFQPDTLDRTMTFSRDEHDEAYSPKPYSQIEGLTRDEILAELQEKTLLQNKGLEFIADLRLLGLDTGIQFYLTGSASGRGAMGQLVHLKEGTSYRDIDLIAVTSHDRETVEEAVEKVMKFHYGVLDKRRTTIDNWFVGEKRHRSNYFSSDKEVVDLAVATSLRGGMIRMDYLRKNFFHQLS